MENTIWQEVHLKNYPTLDKNLNTGVLVIGGGICGILCAYFLSKHYEVVLVEANRLAGERTNKTTAVITALQDALYKDLIARFGSSKAKEYLQANLEAIEEYDHLSKEFDFDFERVSSYKYFSNPKLFEEEVKSIEQLGYSFHKTKEAIEFKNQAQMNPLKLISHLVHHFQIYENTKIVKLCQNTAYTEKNMIQAKHIVVATGYPFLKLKGGFFLKLTQKKSYVSVIPNSNSSRYNAIGSNEGDLYFRTYKDYLLIGGNDQKTGQKPKVYVDIIKHIEKYYKNKEIAYQWINQDCVTLDGLPYIGTYGMSKYAYVATGFNLWGMTGSMIAAKLITDLIEGKENPYANLFSPHRHMPVLPLCKNLKTVVCNMFKIKKRCNHLGCALYYNKEEHTYECPCHGSKYSESLEVIFDPAQKNK